jgi:uncharacterized protein (DUF2236 family)
MKPVVDPVPALEALAAAATAFAHFLRTHELTAQASAEDIRVVRTFFQTFPTQIRETSRVLRAWQRGLTEG